MHASQGSNNYCSNRQERTHLTVVLVPELASSAIVASRWAFEACATTLPIQWHCPHCTHNPSEAGVYCTFTEAILNYKCGDYQQ